MKEFNICILKKIGMTVKEFEILEDVLSEIREYRVYEGIDDIALDNLQEFFSYQNYEKYMKKEKNHE